MRAQQFFERALRVGKLAGLKQCKRALKHFVRRESHWAFLYGW
jgi:seryl-tRNA(Sec) selenium transferase